MCLSYIAATFTANMGVLFGIGLAYLAKEEIEPGRIFYYLVSDIIFAIILSSMFDMYFGNYSIILFIAMLTLLILRVFKNQKAEQSLRLFSFKFCVLGVIFAINSISLSHYIITACLIFLYGLSSTSSVINFKNSTAIFIASLSFSLTAILALFVI